MTDKRTQQMADQSNTEKRPEDWTTGDEPMTGAQRSYLKTLSEEAKVEFDEDLTKAEASMRIDELQQITGRGPATQAGASSAEPNRVRRKRTRTVATCGEFPIASRSLIARNLTAADQLRAAEVYFAFNPPGDQHDRSH